MLVKISEIHLRLNCEKIAAKMKTVVIFFGIVFLILSAEGFHLKEFEEEGEFEEIRAADYPSMFLLEYLNSSY